MRSIVRAEARLAKRAEDVPQTLVAEEVDAFVSEIELDALGRSLSETAAARNRLVARRHLRRCLKIQITLRSQLLDKAVAQPAQRFEKLGGELTTLDQRIEDCLTKRFDGTIRLRVEVVEVRIEALSAGKPGLQ